MHLYFAENGLEALDVIDEEGPFDLVLMDINMPVLDGIETTRRIRANKRYDAMPVVAFTGLNLQEQIDRMREAGMNAHMAKPLNIGRIYTIFDHFLPKTENAA
jgi:CheY-like chemotaxis protein